jgi:hypothetical protein
VFELQSRAQLTCRRLVDQKDSSASSNRQKSRVYNIVIEKLYFISLKIAMTNSVVRVTSGRARAGGTTRSLDRDVRWVEARVVFGCTDRGLSNNQYSLLPVINKVLCGLDSDFEWHIPVGTGPFHLSEYIRQGHHNDQVAHIIRTWHVFIETERVSVFVKSTTTPQKT